MAKLNKRFNPLLKSYPDSEKINRVTILAECLYVRLVAACDDHGNYWGNPDMVAAKLFTHRLSRGELSARDISGALAGLTRAGLGTDYEVDGQMYYHIDAYKALRNDVKLDVRFPCDPRGKPGKNPGGNGPDPGQTRRPNQTKPTTNQNRTEPEPNQSETGNDGTGGSGERGVLAGGSGSGNNLNGAIALEVALANAGLDVAQVADLCHLDGLTPEIVEATTADVRADSGVRKPMGVLVKRLRSGLWTEPS